MARREGGGEAPRRQSRRDLPHDPYGTSRRPSVPDPNPARGSRRLPRTVPYQAGRPGAPERLRRRRAPGGRACCNEGGQARSALWASPGERCGVRHWWPVAGIRSRATTTQKLTGSPVSRPVPIIPACVPEPERRGMDAAGQGTSAYPMSRDRSMGDSYAPDPPRVDGHQSWPSRAEARQARSLNTGAVSSQPSLLTSPAGHLWSLAWPP